MRIRFRTSWKYIRGRPPLLAGAAVLLLCCAGVLLRSGEGPLDGTGFSQVVKDRRGTLLRLTLSADERYRIRTPLADCDTRLVEAVLLKEDKYFHSHPGVNPVALARAFFETVVLRRAKMGGSTITMQLARLLYDLDTGTMAGKLNQMARAFWLEMRWSKREILEAYINLVPCGGNIEGFPAAAAIYFGKGIGDLSLQEILFLCVLPQRPAARSPDSPGFESDLAGARERLFRLWLKRHPESGRLAAHMQMPVAVGRHLPFYAPQYVNELLRRNGDAIEINGTLDLVLQQQIERMVRRYIDRKQTRGVTNAAVMLVDYTTMEVLASIGSADFFNDAIAGQVDGTRSRRSPGSTLKPFIYALAMDQGLIHPMTMLEDAPVSFSEYAPDNFRNDFAGPVKAWEALVASRNVPAVSLASRIHAPDLYGFLHSCDVGDLQPRGHYGLSLVLGGAELSMAELVELYALLANRGWRRSLAYTLDTHPRHQPVGQRLLSPEACYLTLDMLRRQHDLSLHPAVRERDRSEIAYKTGTSIGFKDCWSIAVFGSHVLAVWLGNFDGYGNPEFIGRRLATPLMFEIIEGLREQGLSTAPAGERPETIREAEVCAVSGGIAGPNCRQRVNTLFIPGASPITTCRICREVCIDTRTGYRTRATEGAHVAREVYEFWPTNLLALFYKAGIPRRVPPPFDPAESETLLQLGGERPEIISPLKHTRYIIRHGSETGNDLPLSAVADSDVREIFWFVNETFAGRAGPDETVYWPLKPGRSRICAVDDHGRADYRDVTVEVVY
ncbi:penicillin-binding protein 1C [bacterium]|nr:penicillin-binding protein 1C [bacterium]